MSKRQYPLFGIAILCSAVFQLASTLELAILHTNDVHARFEQTDEDGGPCTVDDADANACYGGVARRMTVIKRLRDENQNTLLLDGGDQFLGSEWFYHYQGAATAYFMNLLGYDAMALGNHEFDLGVSILADFLEDVTFPVVSCNIDARNEPSLQGLFTKSTVIKVAGERVGIVGYTFSETPLISNPGEVTFEGEIDAIQREVDRLTSSGIDKIIALGNAGYDMEVKIGRKTRGIDVIAGGNAFKFLYSGTPPTDDVVTGPYPTVVYPNDDRRSRDKVLLVQDPMYGKYLGFLKVTFDDEGRISHYSGNPVVLDHTVEEDPVTLRKVTDWGESVAAASGAVVGETYVHLDGEREHCRLGECNLGNLIADAMVAAHASPQGENGWSDIGIAILNSGAIRSSIEQGTIRNSDVTNVLPFMDTIDVVEISGHHLMEALERSVKYIDQLKLPGFFLQMSGIRVEYDVDLDQGRRVVSAEVICTECEVPVYEELERGRIYKVAMPSYLARGGDGYTMIKDNKRNQVAGYLDSTILTEYIKKRTPVLQGLETRISLKGDIPSASSHPGPSILVTITSSLLIVSFARFFQ